MMAGCALYNSFDGLRRQTALCVDCIAFLKRTLTVEEANKYLNKWGAICNSPELVSLFTAVTDKTEELKNQYTVFLDVYNNEYLPALAEIQRETEGLSKQHSNVESLEGKLKKGKATQGEVDGATKQLETDTARVQGDTYVKYRTAEIALTKAYVKLHENMANLFKAQLTKLESSPPSLDKLQRLTVCPGWKWLRQERPNKGSRFVQGGELGAVRTICGELSDASSPF